jgi:2,4-dienoyl-CoA reductase-like NADH-dependent reductase (Old Yellow Enzyme family)
MTLPQIQETIDSFAEGARRAREAGLDGVELHAANGYLFTQFLSSAINDRDDQYGGSLENRARFLLDVIRAIRTKAGTDFHLQVKISATEMMNAILNTEGPDNTIEDSVQVSRWVEEAGADAIHLSTGGYFPRPRNPAGELPVPEFLRVYDSMISSGTKTFRNYLLFRNSSPRECSNRVGRKRPARFSKALTSPTPLPSNRP